MVNQRIIDMCFLHTAKISFHTPPILIFVLFVGKLNKNNEIGRLSPNN